MTDDTRSRAVDWISVDVGAVASLAGTDPAAGLGDDEAARRLAAEGPNLIRDAARRGVVRMALAQFADVTVLLLLAAGVVSAVVGDVADTAAIAAIVVLNAVLGAVQEYRAEHALAALRTLAAPIARVRRSDVDQTIAASRLVPGDVMLLEAGNVVPADGRLIETAQFAVEEAALTGESLAVYKSEGAIAADTVVADQSNMAFQGTAVASGHATAIVTATGMRTELGRIASLLENEPGTHTPLQRRLATFGRQLTFAAVALCALIFALGLAQGEPVTLMFMTALSIAVAAVPEALPAVVTMSLALGARRLVRQHALIRRLPAVEALGSVTVICADKTGTLTENRMRVTSATTTSNAMLDALALCNDVRDGQGEATEVALSAFAAEAGVARTTREHQWPRVDEVPFTSERSRMTTIHRSAHGEVVAFTKGAPEAVLPRCVARLTDAGREPLDTAGAMAEVKTMAAGGLRVLAVSMRTLDALPVPAESAEAEQTLIGLVGLVDPPRAGAREAIAACQDAGIRVVMITGDHAATALAIATQLGIAHTNADVMNGSELRALSPEALAPRVAGVRVFARVAPEDKIRIVKALQASGDVAAMTGDGVNDAPALRRADIGVAMGRGGTDIAREASALVLLDDNFATITHAVREGRRVYDNIRKFIRYTLTGNAGEMWPLLLAPLLGLPLPLLPIQILWINLVTDGLPGIALATERAEADVMERPPRPPAESVFARGLWQHVLWAGALIGALTLATQAMWLHAGRDTWRTMTFTVLTLAQLGHVFAIRSERSSLVSMGVFSNRALTAAIAATLLLQLAVIYLPALQKVFRTSALSAGELAAALAIGLLVPIAVEIEKRLARRRGSARET